MVILRENCVSELKDYLPLLHESVREGTEEYLTYYSEKLHEHSPITRASIIRDCIWAKAKIKFEFFPEVKFVEKGLLKYMRIDKGKIYCIKFKKLNKYLLTSNIRTKQVRNFATQISLPFIEPEFQIVNLNVGYQVNELWTHFDFFMTYPRNLFSNYWDQRLDESATTMSGLVELPVDPQPEITITVKPKVAIKLKENNE